MHDNFTAAREYSMSTYETKRKKCALLLRLKLKITKIEDYKIFLQL